MFSMWSRPMFFFDADGAGGGAPEGEQKPDAGASGGKTFTQEEVNTLMGKTRSEGREAGEKALLEKVGLKSVDDLTGIIKAAKDAEEANKSEVQKALDAAKTAADALEEEKRQRQAEKDAFTKRVLDSEIRIAAARPVMEKDGKKVARPAFRADALDDVTVLIDRNLITEKDGKFEGLDAALAALAKSKPYLLGSEVAALKGTPTTTGQKRSEVAQSSEHRPTPTL